MNNDLLAQDKAARLQALDASKSFIVQAPAGSGKTELLIQRFLTLLKYVDAPEEILAITFTKKSANEMRARVVKALQAALDDEPESDHAKQTWKIAKAVLLRDAALDWKILLNPNRLRIQTIDAFCTYLTKQLPLLSHFGSQPEISLQPDVLYREAVREVLNHVEENYAWSHAISNLLLHLDNDFNKLHDLLIGLLEKRDQWLPYIALDTQNVEIKVILEEHLSAVVSDVLAQLVKVFPKSITDDLLRLISYSANNLLAMKSDSPITACAEISSLPDASAPSKILWYGIAKLLLTEEGAFRKSYDNRLGFPAASSTKNILEKQLFSENKKRMIQLVNQISDQDELRILLNSLSTLPSTTYNDSQWQILQSLLIVLKILAAQLRVTFQQHGKIDFIENAQGALTALGSDDSPTDLALALDYQIKHILVDEFQDTSFTQYQLLEKLTMGWEASDGRTLFVVGDPMQSIYRFRQAEVGLFIRMCRNGLGHISLTPLTLSVNFRALAPIVEWNNSQFKNIFPNFNDIATGAVTYSHSIAFNHDTDAETQILVQNIPDNSTIINTIQSLRQRNIKEKIAILVRSRSHLTDIIPELKKSAIPYKAIEIDALISRSHIQDLFALTCALLHLGDRVSWLAVLRAPWCGLKLADLLVIAGEKEQSIIWDQINSTTVFENLSHDAKLRLNRILPILKNALNERERTDLRSWIEENWVLLGGPATLTHISEKEDASEFFKLLNSFSHSYRTLNLDRLKEKMSQLFSVTKQEDNAVNIMTIHAAKGLEFDTVILPHLEKRIPSDDKALLQWMDRPLNNNKNILMLAPIHGIGSEKDTIYEYINLQERIRANYEIDRLFYVATTRAKKRLYLYFQLQESEKGSLRIDGASFLARLWPRIKDEYQAATNTLNVISLNPIAQRPIKRLLDTWSNPVKVKLQTSIAYHQQQSGFYLGSATPKIIGIVVHLLLQQLATQGIEWWHKQSNETKNTYLQYLLQQQGLIKSSLTSALSVINKIVENTLSDKKGLWILQPHKDACSEFTLSAQLNGKIENCILDRTFIDETGTRWIIDYKTTTFTADEMDEFLLKEKEKYLEKMQMYHDAMKMMDNRPIRLGLYFPAIPAWQEWNFANNSKINLDTKVHRDLMHSD